MISSQSLILFTGAKGYQNVAFNLQSSADFKGFLPPYLICFTRKCHLLFLMRGKCHGNSAIWRLSFCSDNICLLNAFFSIALFIWLTILKGLHPSVVNSSIVRFYVNIRTIAKLHAVYFRFNSRHIFSLNVFICWSYADYKIGNAYVNIYWHKIDYIYKKTNTLSLVIISKRGDYFF